LTTMLEQITSLNAQIEEVRNQIGRPPAPPPKRIPAARCTTTQSFSIARLVNGVCSSIHDDGHTRISAMETAKKIAQRTGLPIRYVSWEVDPGNLTGPDAVLLVESVRCTTDDGNSGRHPIRKWTFSSAPPKWLKFNERGVSL
jgi:hypothetical protein